MNWIALPAWYLLRAIAGLMSAAALGSVTALLASLVIAGTVPSWFTPISRLSMLLAAAFGAGAIGGMLVMPPSARVRQPPADDVHGSAPTLPSLILLALTAFAAVQIPPVANWWQSNHALAAELTTPGKPDPVGWDVVFEVVIQAAPFLASLAILAALLSAALALASPPSVRARALAACFLIEAGLVGGLLAVQYAAADISTMIQTLVNESGDELAKTQVADWLGRYAASAGANGARLLWLVAGLAAATSTARLRSGRR